MKCGATCKFSKQGLEWEAELFICSEQPQARSSIPEAAFPRKHLLYRIGSGASRWSGLGLSPQICLVWPKPLAYLSPQMKFGQLQAVDLQSIQPAIRADTEGENLRDDWPETFENREAMIAAVPSYEEPFIKVPKVLNKE
ncbi:hypothetical protein Acr_26g0004670 [Actinidia rufa]|uniref:Glutamyl-tRNA(Gln) amidotransferase subunit C, chloroplastic/mitochondrial n=1 Tax=Actinidia rufa TaxID=165716 RepID=A0A7J0H283_9ERIC|nr:hypothetical protein Acr_26g0004670 [Actinidia rufa]